MTLIKDLIEIPETVQRGDYVLRLAEDIHRPEVVLGNYVVTPELRACFDDALSFIRSSVQGQTSKASYLHGSFGSGKSHFMAVLHLILQGNPAARGIPELAEVIQKHNEWIAGKKFLLVPYHMIGSSNMESGILGGYVDFIRRVHPDAPIPGVYLAEGLFRDAQALRQTMGDDAFFARLNECSSRSGDGGWGELEGGWHAARFEAALAIAPQLRSPFGDSQEVKGEDDRSLLVGDLIKAFFSSYDTQAGSNAEAFVPLDKGLSIISKHAQSLGYDALILFLDELILWLAGRAADLNFIHQEGQKLAKLVEAQTPDRPTPLISFIARQRDLSDLIGPSVPGAQLLNFKDSLGHWEGRFHKITLEDRNLPAIAEKRVLKPKSSAARQELDASFEQTARLRDSVMNVLLTSDGDRQMFRRVYPFSPALVQTLVAVSSVLQRERTALKVMVQLLVEQRETLRLGDIVPVGDLFDMIAHGDEAFSAEMAIHFENAKRLYHQKLLPLLESQHGIRRDEVEQLAYDDVRRTAFRNDDRLIKTLLLSALVPEVESLRALNAERLAALNHGTIKSPIPGREGQEVLRRCRNWAASVGEIRIGEESNPTISIQLSGVDTESIIEQARREDNQGNRIRRVRQMLFEQLGVQGEGEFEQYHEFLWRNTKRQCVVLFRNIRELPDSSLENSEEAWKLVIDFPFDEAGHGPKDDLSRLQAFQHAHPDGAKTLAWVPAFFSQDAQKDLGMLVILEHILTGERFGQYANHLSPQDRQSAKSQLENQRSVLRQRVQNHLEAAYGLEIASGGSLDTAHELELSEQYVSLWPGFAVQPPAAANLAQAMQHLLSQALEREFPAAPHFEAEIKTSHLKKVYEQVLPATQSPDGRTLVDKPLRPLLRQIANPLLLGDMAPDVTHFVLGRHWVQHFHRKGAETGDEMSVEKLRQWIDDPRPMGLPKEAENLVLLIFAAQTNRTATLHSGPCDVSLTNVPEKCIFKQEALPDEKQWHVAVQRAGSMLGIAVSALLSASNVSKLASEVKKKAAEARKPCQAYRELLRERQARLAIDPENNDRAKTASAALALVERIYHSDTNEVIEILAAAEIATSETAMGECIGKASELEGNLDTAGWDLFAALNDLNDDRRASAEKIVAQVREALMSDEHVMQLAPTLKAAQAQAVRLLATAPPPLPVNPPVTPPTPPPITPPPATPAQTMVTEGQKTDLSLDTARGLLEQLSKELKPEENIRLSVSWVIEKGKRGS